MVDGILYLSTMYTRVAALDAETGAERWMFDPRAYEGGPIGAGPTGFKHRGIAYWSDGDDARIFLNSRDRLYAIYASTGELDADFGEGGSVVLTEGHGRPVSRYEFDQTSPPVAFEDLVIVGSRVPDGVQREFDPPGTVQAFDSRTGERRWVFFTIPQSGDDFGADTWEDESWHYTGHTNVWGLMPSGASSTYRRARRAATTGGTPKGSEPVCRVVVVPRRAHGRAAVALPGSTPRFVGLRPLRGAEPGDDKGGRA